MPGASTTAAATGALPVVLHLGGPDAEAVRRWVEGTLGWQPIDAATAGLVPPAVELRDLAAPEPVAAGVPTVLLVDDGAPPDRAARTAAASAPEAVVAWPSGRDQLARTVGDVVERPRRETLESRVLRVGGSAGGVGTTTVTLALTGLAGWSGARTLAAVRGTGLVAPDASAAALARPDLHARADALAGVPAARVVRIADRDPVPEPEDPDLDVLIVDAGVDGDVDVLVCRPDAAALAMLPETTAGAVALVGEGPARMTDLLRAADGRRGVRLPWSARVARAGLMGRVPAGLPGTWLRLLRPLLPDLESSARRASR